MKKRTILVFVLWCLFLPVMLLADDCIEGDCNNGVGSGFVHGSKIYEGEWRDGMPHGKGKLYVKKDKIIEGIWEKGQLVEEKNVEDVKEPEAAEAPSGQLSGR